MWSIESRGSRKWIDHLGVRGRGLLLRESFLFNRHFYICLFRIRYATPEFCTCVAWFVLLTFSWGFFNRVSKHTPYLLFTVFSSGYFSPGQLCWYWKLVTGSSSITNAYKDTTSCLRPEVYFTDRWSRNTYFRWAPNFFNFIRHLQYDHGDILKLFSKKVGVKNEKPKGSGYKSLERLPLLYLYIPVLKCLFYWK